MRTGHSWVVFLLPLAAAACASSGAEDSSTSASAVTIPRCPIGTSIDCTSEFGPLICTCVPNPTTVTVSGTVSGLGSVAGSETLVLGGIDGWGNAEETKSITHDGAFTFNITNVEYPAIVNQPAGETCEMTNAVSPYNNVSIFCGPEGYLSIEMYEETANGNFPVPGSTLTLTGSRGNSITLPVADGIGPYTVTSFQANESVLLQYNAPSFTCLPATNSPLHASQTPNPATTQIACR